ncbi:hypothetical protein Ciccas_010123 [Cichlidogyrus casuarinus]|uniref:Uncharacterized protein n=1 Tax=Cichlidogyrus casuarinus TaxID=1844966 RepID=A0ABD2PV04_9PLAT
MAMAEHVANCRMSAGGSYSFKVYSRVGRSKGFHTLATLEALALERRSRHYAFRKPRFEAWL